MSTLSTEVVRVLLRFKNAILEGPPGTGKTHVVSEVARKWTATTGRPLLGTGAGTYAITFHPSTAYEDFVEGMRYDEAAQGFTRRDGFLLRAVKEALANPQADYLILLDEVNRANVPKVLGDVLLCMEASKRVVHDGAGWTGGLSVSLPYSGAAFAIPDNIYLLGTMNSTDRSIAPLDAALRRRFGFIRTSPLTGSDLQQLLAATEGQESARAAHRSIDELTNLNTVLRECLGPDAELGHSYLFGMNVELPPPAQASDPLARIAEVAAARNAQRGFWLEVGSGNGGSHNQFDIPDTPREGRPALSTMFYPMRSGEAVVDVPSANQAYFDVRWNSILWSGNSIQYNGGGSNRRLKLMGQTDDGRRLSQHGSDLEQKLQVWLSAPDHTFDLVLLDRNDANIAALRSVSEWRARTMPSERGRWYGQLDLARLEFEPADRRPTDHQDAQWLTWRYAILPQLVDTLTQLGATELIDPRTRADWLASHGQPASDERLALFDRFLHETLRLEIRERGHGLSRSLTIEELLIADPPVLSSEFTPELADFDEGTDELDNVDGTVDIATDDLSTLNSHPPQFDAPGLP
ncbi:McrB family protein [Modestobacter sp. URMC 112]